MYGNGYGYQVFSVILTEAVGVDARWYVLLGNPVLAATVFPAVLYAVYRRAAGTPILAMLSLMLLYTVPEFLFVYSRATHEKISLTMILLVVAALTGPLRGRGASWAAALILAAFALSSMNAYFSLIPLAALAGAALGQAALARGQARLAGLQAAREASGVIPLLLLFPAVNILYVIRGSANVLTGMADLARNLVEGLTRGLLGGGGGESVPYAVAGRVYPLSLLPLLEAPTVLLALLLAYAYLKRLRGRVTATPYESAGAALAAAVAGAVAADLAGGLFGSSTLIVRTIPMLAVITAPLAAATLVVLASRLTGRGVLALALTIALLAAIAVPGFLKATRSPLVSRHIPYYTPQEEAMLEWLVSHDRSVSVYLDNRLRSVLYLYEPNADFHYLYVVITAPYYLYVKYPWQARALAVTSEMVERGVYTGLAPVPLEDFLREHYNTTLDGLLRGYSVFYSNTGALVALEPAGGAGG